MNCIQICLVLAASCAILVSADLASYQYGYNDPSIAELNAPALGCDDSLASGYVVTGSTPAPILRSAVDIEPARIISASPSPTLSSVSEFVSVTTPAPLLRSAIDIEPARIINAAPMNMEARIETSPLLDTFRPALATYDSTAWQARLENASPAPIAVNTITKTTNIGKSSTIISEAEEINPMISTQYSISAPQVESKITTVHSSPIISPLSARMLPSMSSSYSYSPQTYASSYLNTAPQYYSSTAAYAPQYYSSSAAYAPRYYSSAAAYAPQYYSSAANYARQYYSSAAAYAPRYYSSAAAYAPRYYSSSAAYAPRYYSSAAAYAPQYYSSAAAYSPQYYSSAAAFAPQYSDASNYYSAVSVAADEPCYKK